MKQDQLFHSEQSPAFDYHCHPTIIGGIRRVADDVELGWAGFDRLLSAVFWRVHAAYHKLLWTQRLDPHRREGSSRIISTDTPSQEYEGNA